jgi:hypothetical protein
VVQTDVIGHRPDSDGNPPGTEDRLMKEAVKGVLDAYILPLLEAGQAMRDWKFDDHNSLAKMQLLYDAAKQAAMEGR